MDQVHLKRRPLWETSFSRFASVHCATLTALERMVPIPQVVRNDDKLERLRARPKRSFQRGYEPALGWGRDHSRPLDSTGTFGFGCTPHGVPLFGSKALGDRGLGSRTVPHGQPNHTKTRARQRSDSRKQGVETAVLSLAEGAFANEVSHVPLHGRPIVT